MEFIFFYILLLIISFWLHHLSKNNSKNRYNNNRKYYDSHKTQNFNQANTQTYMPYAFKNLLTNTEYNFYIVLEKVTSKYNNKICPKVGLKDIAYTTDKKQYMHWFAKISQKHVDFLVCDSNLKVLLAIELDDYSHEKEKAKKNDTFKNEFFQKIGIPLIRFQPGNYSLENIEKILSNIIY